MQKYNTDHATDNHSSTLDAAINLGAKGIPVFPCKVDKTPLTLHGFKNATADPEVILKTWERFRDVPCIGVPTGEATSLLVIDVDMDNGKQGEESLAHLEETYEPLPSTRKVRTGGGGIQYLFRYPEGYGRIGNSTNLLPGIDVRGEGGYIIVPPSRSFKGPYTWEEKGKRAYAPEWLIDLILTQPSKNGRDGGMDSFTGEDGTVVIPHGARDNTLFRLASSFRGKGLPLSAATMAVEKTDEECSEYPGGKDRSDRSAEEIVRKAYQRYESGRLRISEGKDKEPTPQSVADLMRREFDPIKWIVEDIFCEGVTLLSSRADAGKSLLVTGCGVAVATGRIALGGKATVQGDVLYLALDDNERRLQSRVRKILQDREADLSRFYYETEWERADEGGLERLDAWLTDHPDAKLVIIDVLANWRPEGRGNKSIYKLDYEAVRPLGKLAYKHGVAIVVTHHNNKLVSPDDPFDSISGSMGLRGGVDNSIVIKRDQGSNDAVFWINGNEIERPGQYAMTFDPTTLRWTIEGDARSYFETQERREIEALMGTSIGEDEEKDHWTPLGVAGALNKNRDAVRGLMSRIVRSDNTRITRVAHGKYRHMKFTEGQPSDDS
jgi:hypothetical protein